MKTGITLEFRSIESDDELEISLPNRENLFHVIKLYFKSLSSSVDDLDNLLTITSGSPGFLGLGLTLTFISGGTKGFEFDFFDERNEDLTLRKNDFLWMILVVLAILALSFL